jgi:hypothetical protein
MSNSTKSDLLDLLAQSFSATQALLDEVDLETVVYENPDWRVQDVIWHLAVWDRQVAQSIEAFHFGDKYAIPDFDEQKFNVASVKEGRDLSPEQVLKGSNQARQKFQRAVEQFSSDQIEAELLYPWGDESGDIATLVNYMVEHDEEHRQEIRTAAKR